MSPERSTCCSILVSRMATRAWTGRRPRMTRWQKSGTTPATQSLTIGGGCMAFPRGGVVLLPFPFSDVLSTKVWPAVVLSSAEYQEYQPDLLVAAITSRLLTPPGPFDYVLADWAWAGLRLPSALNPNIATIHPSRVLHRWGRSPQPISPKWTAVVERHSASSSARSPVAAPQAAPAGLRSGRLVRFPLFPGRRTRMLRPR